MNWLGCRIQIFGVAMVYGIASYTLVFFTTRSFASPSGAGPTVSATPVHATITIPATVIPAPPTPLVTGAEAHASSVDPAHELPKKNKVYRPKIFKPHEFATLKVLTESILRDDEMPGGREARANEFIDFQIAYDPEIQDRFREGLAWLDKHSRKLHGRKFVSLKPEHRREIIQCLEVKAKHRPGEEQGREFFDLAKRYTYMGFYASEEALRIAIPVQKKPSRPKRRFAGTETVSAAAAVGAADPAEHPPADPSAAILDAAPDQDPSDEKIIAN